LLAEQQQIQLLLTIAAYAKVVTALPVGQKERNIRNVTQKEGQKHALNTEASTDSAAEEEQDAMEVEIPQPQIDLWKPIGQTGDRNFDNLEHHPDTGIAMNFNNELLPQPLSPNIIPFTDLTHPSPRHTRQPLGMSFALFVHSNIVTPVLLASNSESIIEIVCSRAHDVQLKALPASPAPTEVTKTANGEINPSIDHVTIEPLSPSRSVETQSQGDMKNQMYMEKGPHNEASEADDMTVPWLSEKVNIE
jgi:hypothetical protein